MKHNAAHRVEMFQAEAEGLDALLTHGSVRVPRPICWGVVNRMSFLALEYIDLGTSQPIAEERLGRCLAALHRVTQSQYGWHRDNTIGATPQLNGYCETWLEFMRERRLGFQLRLAAQNGHQSVNSKGERLLARLGVFFGDHPCKPSLLHGDLWHGNIGATRNGEPVIFDPAVYFGDRETDIAMTQLFGGFGDSFYAAYREEWPLPTGYETRRRVYDLYHVLNHLNLFGRSYLAQAERLLDRLLAESNG